MTGAALVVGGAVVAGAAAAVGTAAAAGSQADAIKTATGLQVEELRRQYDDAMRRLQPLLNNQYAANDAFANLMGYGSGRQMQEGVAQQTGVPPGTPSGAPPGTPPGGGAFPGGIPFTQQGYNPNFARDPNAAAQQALTQTPPGVTGPAFDQRFGYGQEGGFVDPNLNPLRLGGETALDTEYGRQVAENTLAGRTPEEDIAIRRARETGLFSGVDQDSLVQQVRGDQLRDDVGARRLAAGSLTGDERFRFAQETAIAGDTFETSPGYAFALEESNRALDRQLSRGGGNISGAAIIEAQRRAQGLANQEYYNYAALRQADLSRQDAAAASYQNLLSRDASRLDAAALTDITRGDAAVADARRREELDLQRGDLALASYLQRYQGDIARQDQAVLNNQALRQYDLQRQDQGYYNYLGNLAAAAGVGANYVGQAVGLGQSTAQNVAGAYANQGSALANIYGGRNAAYGQIAVDTIGNLTNIGQQAGVNALYQQGLGGNPGVLPQAPPGSGYHPLYGGV